jgi:FtsH-binding integral membrane protein
VTVGMVFRVIAGQGTAVAFVIVALAFLGLALLGWRAVAKMAVARGPVARLGRTRTTSAGE